MVGLCLQLENEDWLPAGAEQRVINTGTNSHWLMSPASYAPIGGGRGLFN